MTWLLTIKRAFAWLKEHWQIPFLAVWTLGVWILTRRNTQAIAEVLEIKDDSHKKEVEVLKDSHSDELSERDKLLEKYLKTVEEIENRNKSYKIKLREEEKLRVKEIIENAKGDDNEIKSKIEDLFGVTYTD
jgi:long-subunit acyl-CoA synthetase (AMP-forming)